MAIGGISGASAGFQGLSQLQGSVAGQAQGSQQQAASRPQADQQGVNIQGPSGSSSGGDAPSSASSQSAVQPVGTGPARPGQAGAGIGDLQQVAPGSVARGQIVDIAA